MDLVSNRLIQVNPDQILIESGPTCCRSPTVAGQLGNGCRGLWICPPQHLPPTGHSLQLLLVDLKKGQVLGEAASKGQHPRTDQGLSGLSVHRLRHHHALRRNLAGNPDALSTSFPINTLSTLIKDTPLPRVSEEDPISAQKLFKDRVDLSVSNDRIRIHPDDSSLFVSSFQHSHRGLTDIGKLTQESGLQ